MDGLISAINTECNYTEDFLLDKYGISSAKRDKTKTSIKKSILLPFSGTKHKGCEAVCLNYGLYTQCEKPISAGQLCMTCNNVVDKKGHTQYGMIDDRINAGDAFRDTKGKKPVPYGNVLEKLGISKDDAMLACREAGYEMDDKDFELVKATRGRPKKEKEVKEVKQRGRPKKDKEIISNMGDDLISKLFDAKDATEKDTKEKDVKEKDAEKDTKEKDNDINIADPDDESDDEVNVIEFEYDGITYYRDDDGVVYKNMEGDEVGNWDEETSTIKFKEE